MAIRDHLFDTEGSSRILSHGFCHQQRIADEKWIRRSIRAQDAALAELKRVALELYEAAIQLDSNMIPLSMKGPSLTPPLKTYACPDGDYIDTTRSWV